MHNAGMDDSQAGIKSAGKKYQQSQICRWYHFNSKKWKGTKELLGEGERGELKAGLKLSIHKMKIMTSIPITSWKKDGGKKMETVTDFDFFGLQSHCEQWLHPQK